MTTNVLSKHLYLGVEQSQSVSIWTVAQEKWHAELNVYKIKSLHAVTLNA